MARQNLRQLPSVAKLIARPELAAYCHHDAVAGARQAIDEARSAGNGAPSPEEIAARAAEIAGELAARFYRPVVNASGTILNTGLGRARLAEAAAEAIRDAAASHSRLELDLESGLRGDRQAGLSRMLCELTGAQAALVVNNNAAAVLLAVNSLAAGREVLLSRGQSVEIGGAFRMPDVVLAAGARLVDVGCTNKTRASDYEEACGEETALVLRCHPSNFAMTGFVEEPPPAELAETARRLGLKMLDDVGSGCLVDTAEYGLPHEPTIRESLEGGADVVTASGDKLLGGPQAGLILGGAEEVARIRKNPLARAVRIDKLAATGLEATLRLYLEQKTTEIPTIRYLSRSLAEVKGLALLLRGRLRRRGVAANVAEGTCEPGGGSLPGTSLPSFRVGIDGSRPDDLARRLRIRPVPVVGYVRDGRFWLDLRTVEGDEIRIIEDAVAAS